MMERLIDLHRPMTVCKASAGTGKTYTLAAYYVGLLLSGEDYRSILAITFTNKATAEMSERILTYLYALSQGEEADFLALARRFMLRYTNAPDVELRQRAGECFKKMLLDYDNVHVMTIDAFLQTLLNGLASILHTSTGASTELDIKHVVKEAVDQLLTTDLTDENLGIIERYSQYKYLQASSWDIRQGLRTLAEKLYDEKAQLLDNAHQIIFDPVYIAKRREQLEQSWRACAEVQRMEELLSALDKCDLSMKNGSAVESAKKNIRSSIDDSKSIVKSADRFRGLTDKQIEAVESHSWKEVPPAVQDMILEATQLIRRSRSFYNTIQLSIAMSRDMELMASLQHVIQRNLTEANCALLARTASILSEALRDGDADFILEKAGIRYHHVLMDEFQDTSRMQWDVIKRLLEDMLASEGNTLLIVGDIKQSIYRWRNGDWHIMDGLSSERMSGSAGERINGRFTSLTKNYRSSEAVVQFNLSLFQYIIDEYGTIVADADEEEQQLIRRIYGENFDKSRLPEFYQADKKPGGSVCFRTFESCERKAETQEMMATAMFEEIESLLSRGMKASDILILVRSGKGAFPLITRMHAELDVTAFPHLTKVPIVSENSFLLGSSSAVKTVIAALQCVQDRHDDVAANYLRRNTTIPDVIEQIHGRVSSKTPLYEAVNELVSLLLTDADGRYAGTQTAYVNSLLDYTREYVSAYGSRIDDFLEYWEDTLKDKSIPASSVGAIRIMTIHKSKGLQAKTVFVPFCDWEIASPENVLWTPLAPSLAAGDDYVPVTTGNEMAESDYKALYAKELKDARVDSLNMLYVALTRAEENLYIYTDRPTDDHVGRYIEEFMKVRGERLEVSGKRLEAKGERLEVKPFAFDKTEHVESAELWANSDRIRFVQSREGALYTDYGEEAYRRQARMDEGILCHDIFSHIHKADELPAVLDEFESKGLIQDTAQRERLERLISSAWEGSPEMKDWFTSPWRLELESGIYANSKEVRPDRVMINPETNEAIVLDYKFGHWEKEYIDQVQGYMQALRDMGHSPVRGYLWFAQQNRLVPVKG